ncbi:MAG: cell division protein FtsL [Suilimivivens sp.]
MTENRRRTAYTGNYVRSQRNNAYVYGNTARRLQAVPDEYERPVRKTNHAPRKNRDRALYMNVGYVLFLASALLVVGFVLTSYLTLKSDITSSVKHIAQLESELNNMKLDNDERESRISSNTNLEEVRQTAIQELGMQYAGEGQIITFNSEDNDYVIQKGEIPD